MEGRVRGAVAATTSGGSAGSAGIRWISWRVPNSCFAYAKRYFLPKSRLSLKRNASFRGKVMFYLSETILFPSRALARLRSGPGRSWEGCGSSGTAPEGLQIQVKHMHFAEEKTATRQNFQGRPSYINKLPINRPRRPLCNFFRIEHLLQNRRLSSD